MRQETKALLLSAFVCPGAGHYMLKKYYRAAFFFVITVAALIMLMRRITAIAQGIADEIVSGKIPFDAVQIMQAIHNSVYGELLHSAGLSVQALIACWFIALADCYRAGRYP